jgi:hypothetical protein
MGITNKAITEKKFKRLSIQVSLDGLSFCASDTVNKDILEVKQISFSDFPKNFSIENSLWKSFMEFDALTAQYDEIAVLHENNLNSFVPEALFDENYKGSYLQYNTKVFETDFFTYDQLKNHEMVNVYVPYVNINNYLIDQFGSFEYKHFGSLLVEGLLKKSPKSVPPLMYVHVAGTHFEIIIIQNQKLQLYNSFEYQNADDFLYFILFTAEQLHLNPDDFNLVLLGQIKEGDSLYNKLYEYVRNVTFLEAPENLNGINAAEYRKYFVILRS